MAGQSPPPPPQARGPTRSGGRPKEQPPPHPPPPPPRAPGADRGRGARPPPPPHERPPPAPRRSFRAAIMATTMGVTLALSPLAMTAPALAQNQTQQVQSQTAVPLQSLSPIVERVMPAVVNISVTLKNGAVASDEVG